MAPGFGFLGEERYGRALRMEKKGAQHAAPLPATACRYCDVYRFDIDGTTRILPIISATRSATMPSAQPIANAIMIRIPPLMSTGRAPMAEWGPTHAPRGIDKSQMSAY